MGSSDGEGLSQQYLELVDAYKKRFMPQNGRVVVLKCSTIWKKMRKSFKTLSELKLKCIPKAWKREAMAHKNPCALRLVETFWLVETFISKCLNFS